MDSVSDISPILDNRNQEINPNLTLNLFINVPCILLSILTICLDVFVINYYRKSQMSVVSQLYSLIGGADIVAAASIIYQFIVVTLFIKGLITGHALDRNIAICYTLFTVSYRSSVFYNLMLSACRTIVILRPFYRVRKGAVLTACLLYTLPWLILAGIDIYVIYFMMEQSLADDSLFLDYLLLGSTVTQIWSMSVQAAYVFIVWLAIIPFLLPAFIILITCTIQIIGVLKPGKFQSGIRQKHVTITVLSMSSAFILSNTGFYIVIMYKLGTGNGTGKSLGQTSATLGIILPMINAAVNPLIIISRSKEIRSNFLDFWKNVTVVRDVNTVEDSL